MNCIVILLDTLRRDHLGFHGNSWIHTPNLDALATRSVFDNAYISSYPCMPARREIWTGRHEFPWRGWGPLEPDDLDFPKLLKAVGRPSMLITDHYHLWERRAGNYHYDFSGTEFIRGQEADNWVTDPNVSVDYPARPEKLAGHARQGAFAQYARNTAHRLHERDYFFPQVVQRAMDWLDRNDTHRDFCLFLDCFEPHEPWDPPRRYWERYNPGHEGEQVVWPTYGTTDSLTREELRQIRALYAGELTLVDTWLGILLGHIERLGLLENTAIIVTTDHGHLLGEHGLIGKPWTAVADSNLYQELVHIPLLLYVPGASPQRRRELVHPVDVYPTLLEALDVEVPDAIHGRSLLPLLKGEDRDGLRRMAWWGRYGEAISVSDGEWVLIKWPEDESNEPLYWYSVMPPVYSKMYEWIGPREGDRYPVRVARGGSQTALYDLRQDYSQERNLVGERPDQVERLTKALADQLRAVGAPGEQFQRLGMDGNR